MKTTIICLIIPVLLLSCSKKSDEVSTKPQQSQNQPDSTGEGNSLPAEVVESPVTKEVNDISNQVATLFATKNYDKIDALAIEYRTSKERYAAGAWKLDALYKGFELPNSASDTEWEAHIADIRAWQQANPNSITASVALAANLTDYAWKARGGAYADSVTGEGWRLFSQRLNQSLQVLVEAEKITEKCPHYWVILLTDAAGLQMDRSKFDTIFNHAVSYYPDYTPIYTTRATFLQPKWGGNEGEWVNDLTTSADKIGGDDGDALYTQVIWVINSSQDSTNPFKHYNASWERLKRGFDVLEKRYPDSLAAISKHADLASQANDWAVAMKYYQMTGGKVDMTVWHTQQNYDGFVKWVLKK